MGPGQEPCLRRRGEPGPAASSRRQDRTGDEKGTARPGPLRNAEEGHAAGPRLQHRRGRTDTDLEGQAESRGAELPESDRITLFGAGRRLPRRLVGFASSFGPPTNRPRHPTTPAPPDAVECPLRRL